MFSLRPRARKKLVGHLHRLSGSEVATVVVGRAQFRWTDGAIITIALVIGAMVAFAFAKTLVSPGWLVILGVLHSVRPPRVIAIADRDLFVASRSFVTGKPKAVIGRYDLDALQRVRRDSRKLRLGDEEITLPSKEHQFLLRIIEQARIAYTASLGRA